jgi:hypothetical protein
MITADSLPRGADRLVANLATAAGQDDPLYAHPRRIRHSGELHAAKVPAGADVPGSTQPGSDVSCAGQLRQPYDERTAPPFAGLPRPAFIALFLILIARFVTIDP